MDFETYKEQLLEALATYKSKIEDSESYIRLKEKYDTLSPNLQKMIIYGTSILVIYFIYSIPASYVSSSQENLSYFEENRQITRELIRAGRVARTIKLPPPAPGISSLKTQLESKLTQQTILPEQKTATTEVDNIAAKTIVPKSIEQKGLKTTLKKLNIKQVIKLGEALDSISSTRLMNIAIQADSKDPHFYNVDYEIAAFSVPQPQITPTKDKESKFKSRYKSKKSRFKKKDSK